MSHSFSAKIRLRAQARTSTHMSHFLSNSKFKLLNKRHKDEWDRSKIYNLRPSISPEVEYAPSGTSYFFYMPSNSLTESYQWFSISRDPLVNWGQTYNTDQQVPVTNPYRPNCQYTDKMGCNSMYRISTIYLTMEKRKWRWIPPTPADDKLTRSWYHSPLNNQEGSGLRWVPPALPSSQRHRIDGSNLSTPSSKKTFLRDEERGDLTNRDRFLLRRR